VWFLSSKRSAAQSALRSIRRLSKAERELSSFKPSTEDATTDRFATGPVDLWVMVGLTVRPRERTSYWNDGRWRYTQLLSVMFTNLQVGSHPVMDAPSSSKLISVMTSPKQVTPFVQNGGHDTPSIFRAVQRFEYSDLR
jgi:hypothetical protein